MAHFTRRQFLEDSLLAAAAAAAWPAGSALAVDQPRRSHGKKSSGQKLRVAVVGVNGRGSEHIREYLANPHVTITHIVDVDGRIGRRAVDAVAKRQGSTPKLLRDLRQALDDPALDAVSIATPNHWHALAAIWAMQAGKDVYVEKPVSHNVSEGRRIVETARKYQRICQAGTQCRSMQGTIEAIAYVHGGKIGDVRLARGLCYKRRPSIGPAGNYHVPAEVDYHLWCGPARMLPLTRKRFHYDWHWQREWGNGDMGNQAPHQLDVARWGLGIDRLPDRVLSYGGRLGYQDAGDVANTEVGVFRTGEKTLVFEVRGLETDPLRNARVGVIFYGSEGSVVLSTYSDGAAFDLQGKLVRKFRGGGDHFGNFVDAVLARDPKRLHADIVEGHLSCAHSHLANISYYLGHAADHAQIAAALHSLDIGDEADECLRRTTAHLAANGVDLGKTPLTLGESLAVDAAAETIVDNHAAAALLTRQYRAPFLVPAAHEV